MRAYVKEIPGRIHEKSEDAAYESVFLDNQGQETGLFIVADGLSGYAGTTASNSIVGYLRENVEMPLRTRDIPSHEVLVKEAIVSANDFLEQNDKGRTTLDLVLVTKRQISYAHLGDSCIYSVRPGEMRLCTPLEKNKQGIPTNYVGKSYVDGDARHIRDRIHFFSEERDTLHAPTHLLLATDGLLSRLTTDEIEEFLGSLRQATTDPKKMLDKIGERVYVPRGKIVEEWNARDIAKLRAFFGQEHQETDETLLLEAVREEYCRQRNKEFTVIIDAKLRWDDTSLVLIDLADGIEKKLHDLWNLRTNLVPKIEAQNTHYARQLSEKDVTIATLQEERATLTNQLSSITSQAGSLSEEHATLQKDVAAKEEKIRKLEEANMQSQQQLKKAIVPLSWSELGDMITLRGKDGK